MTLSFGRLKQFHWNWRLRLVLLLGLVLFSLQGGAVSYSNNAVPSLAGDDDDNNNDAHQRSHQIQQGSCIEGVVDGDSDGVCTSPKAINDSSSSSSSSSCKDSNDLCSYWASIGECNKNANYMKQFCRLSCNTCDDDEEEDTVAPDDSKNGKNNEEKIHAGASVVPDTVDAGTDFGVAQTPSNKLKRRIEATREYMKSAANNLPENLMAMCTNNDSQCTYWASIGECEANPNYMKKQCAPACHSCDFLSIELRCSMDREVIGPDVWGAGDLEKTFRKLTSEPYLSKYDVQILSSPETTSGPWIIQLENVISEEEAESLIRLGGVEGYQESKNVGKTLANGDFESVLSSTRTSTNSWCQFECYKHEHAQAVINRLSNMTGVPETNAEYLQLLRYEEGQFYKAHSDYIPLHKNRQGGPRILTFYMYLNDVEEGGGTNFDRLGLTVTPKRGRAVLWPSVFDDQPVKKDGRTTHQALPVIKGEKYGANAWFHLRDFKTPHSIACQ